MGNVCDVLHKKLEEMGCTPKSGTNLRKARGIFQEVSGKTLKKCVEEWLVEGKAEHCNCPCNGLRATQKNNREITEALTSLEETWGLPPVGSEISERLDVAQNLFDHSIAIDEASYEQESEKKGILRHKPIRKWLKERPTFVLEDPLVARFETMLKGLNGSLGEAF